MGGSAVVSDFSAWKTGAAVTPPLTVFNDHVRFKVLSVSNHERKRWRDVLHDSQITKIEIAEERGR